jgi:hypothetical protein
MRYKTVIEVVTEAKDKSEAMEIVGEYLSGDVFSGVEMKYSTRSVNGVKKVGITITALSALVLIGLVSLYFAKQSGFSSSIIPASSAIQAPLQAQALTMNNQEFKAQWQREHAKEALRKIKLSR